MASNVKLLSSIISALEDSVLKYPGGGFFFPLKALMWLPILHEATLNPPQTIKHGLLRYVQDYTYALDKPPARPFRDKFKISAPTINKYLDIIKNKTAVDYNYKTWDQLFDLILAAPLKNGKSISQFWWSFCRTYYPQIFALLFDKSDPYQSTATAFWLHRANKNLMVNLSSMAFYSSYVLMLKLLLPSLSKKDSKRFRSADFLKNVISGIERCSFESNEGLVTLLSCSSIIETSW